MSPSTCAVTRPPTASGEDTSSMTKAPSALRAGRLRPRLLRAFRTADVTYLVSVLAETGIRWV